jgi:hypothetical protein
MKKLLVAALAAALLSLAVWSHAHPTTTKVATAVVPSSASEATAIIASPTPVVEVGPTEADLKACGEMRRALRFEELGATLVAFDLWDKARYADDDDIQLAADVGSEANLDGNAKLLARAARMVEAAC